MILNKLKRLVKYLRHEYHHSYGEIELAFNDIFEFYSKENTIIILVGKDKQIIRQKVNRKNIKIIFKMPVYEEKPASVIDERLDILHTFKDKIRTFRLKDRLEPFVYFEE